jgi:tRNA pseudouridine38-40 synthase
MAHYQVILAYDGAQFSGSQRQAKARTIQGELESALRELGWSGRSVLMAGRTDAGVHASGQVATFELNWQHENEDLLRALNANLPADMAVRNLEPANPGFHPRFDARSRIYRYRLYCQPIRDPLREKHAWRIWPPVVGEVLEEVAALFVGKHDFSFFGTPSRPESSPVRTVMKSIWEFHRDEWHYEVQADAFLYRMVRRLVFVQVAAAQGNLSTEIVARSLTTKRETSQEPGVPTGAAPAQGLTLIEVTY